MQLPADEKEDEQLQPVSDSSYAACRHELERLHDASTRIYPVSLDMDRGARLPSPGKRQAHRSKFARRRFSIANHTMTQSAMSMTQPVTVGPVANVYIMKPPTPLLGQHEHA